MNACMKVYMNKKPSFRLSSIGLRVGKARFVYVTFMSLFM